MRNDSTQNTCPSDSTLDVAKDAQPRPWPDASPLTTRWRTCLHEAGHALAGRRLSGRPVRAVVYDDSLGAAYLDIDALPQTVNEALAIAAGPQAEALADVYDPPQTAPPPVPLAAAYPEQAKPLVAQLKESLPDAVRIARWCIQGRESQPDQWTRRHHWIHAEARYFIRRHQQEIVEAAAKLFAGGTVTLPVGD